MGRARAAADCPKIRSSFRVCLSLEDESESSLDDRKIPDVARMVHMSTAEAAPTDRSFQELLLHRPEDPHPASHSRARLRRRLLSGLNVSVMVAGALGGVALGAVVHASSLGMLLAATLYAAIWYLAATLSGDRNDEDSRPWMSTLRQAKTVIFVGLLISWPCAGVLALIDARSPVVAAIAAATVAIGGSIAGRSIVQGLVYRSHRRQRTLIIGSGAVASQVVERLRHFPRFAVEPVGLVDDDVHVDLSPDLPLLGRLADLEEVVQSYDIDRVIVAFTRSGHDDLLRCIRVCWDNEVAIDIVPRLFEFIDGARAFDQVGGLPMLSITAPQLSSSARAVKRVSDIVLSLLGLLLLSPLLIAVAVLIKLDSRGPVFFRQVRIGRAGKSFRIYKYRSMYLDAEERKREYMKLNDVGDGVMFKIHEDPRVTRIGRLLRRSSIDELPQLINVLRGDMSLVGPRPLIPEEAGAVSQSWHERRLDLRPGLTGLWQVYGRSTIPFQDMLRFDYQYVAKWSLSRDLEIMLLTVPAMLSARGAY
jgi:exopolysaccharide biosynthesis polyprenyl glycosylphosphotransferase